MMNNLLAVTKMEEGSLQLRMQPELLEEIVEEAAAHIRLRDPNRKIQISASDDTFLVSADAHLLGQVFVNLLDNALKYTPPETLVKISVYKKEDRAIVDVIDEGEGIADQEKVRIFQSFYTHAASDTSRSLGLGLTLCKSIVQIHQGRIDVLDNHPKGSVFRVDLPLMKGEYE